MTPLRLSLTISPLYRNPLISLLHPTASFLESGGDPANLVRLIFPGAPGTNGQSFMRDTSREAMEG